MSTGDTESRRRCAGALQTSGINYARSVAVNRWEEEPKKGAPARREVGREPPAGSLAPEESAVPEESAGAAERKHELAEAAAEACGYNPRGLFRACTAIDEGDMLTLVHADSDEAEFMAEEFQDVLSRHSARVTGLREVQRGEAMSDDRSFAADFGAVSRGEITADELVQRWFTMAEPADMTCGVCGAADTLPGCESGNLPVEPGEKRYARCPRALTVERKRRTERRFEAAGVEPYYRHCTLDNYETLSRSGAAASGAVRDYLADYPARRAEGRGICLWGAVGVGKTHLAYAVVNALIKSGDDALALRGSRLLEMIRETFVRDEGKAAAARSRLDSVTSAPILLVDDIGKTPATDWVAEQIHELLSRRRRRMLPTLITTNYRPEGDLAARIGEASESRIHEMCEIHELRGDDYRRRRKG